MMRSLATWCLCASAACAEGIEVPHLSDGKVDMVKVMTSFKLTRPLTRGGEFGQLSGQFLGDSFIATIAGDPVAQSFTLTIRSLRLSEEATYLASVLLNDAICLTHDRPPDGVDWRETAVRQDDGWRVTAS